MVGEQALVWRSQKNSTVFFVNKNNNNVAIALAPQLRYKSYHFNPLRRKCHG